MNQMGCCCHSAKKELKNDDGHTAFDIAEMNDQKELCEILK